MRILTIGTDRKLFDAGSAVFARQIKYAKLFNRSDIVVYSLRGLNLRPVHNEESNLHIHPTSSRSRLLYVIDAIRVAMTLDKPDLVSAQDPFESGLTAFFVARYLRVPLHLQIHTDFLSPWFIKESFLNRIRFYIAKFLIGRSSALRVVTERVKRSILDAGLVREGVKIDVLPIFVDTEKIRNSPISINLHDRYSQFNFIILMASRITREKNIPLAISAMREVIKKHPRAGLVIVGDGGEKDGLRALIEMSGLTQNVILEPWNSDLISYYKSADLFLLTSDYEGYGMTVIEALSAGLPVVMSDVGVANEVLVNGESGLVFRVGDLAELISALERIISDSDLRNEIKNNIAKINLSDGEDNYLDRYKQMFERML